MKHGRIDPRLVEHFSAVKASSSDVQASHGVAASIHAEASQELLKELPAVGPITYLPQIEVLLAEVDLAGYQHLVEHQEVHAISDAELTFDVPAPLDAEQQSSYTTRQIVRADASTFSDHEGKGVTVAVMDTGVYAGHEDFNGRVIDQISCVEGSYQVGDVHGHGTHVAGSIGGATLGVASESSILDLRVFGPHGGASTSSILRALDLCVQRNVDIVNMSIGSNYASRVLDAAVDATAQAGVLTCVAAGNSGPSAYTINSPASAQQSIAVAATLANGQVASFSSRGPNPWYAWAKPDIASYGVNVISASHRGGTCVMSGTSMATPAVAGVLACLIERFNEEPEARFIAESVLKEAGDPLGQSYDAVGRGYVTIPHIEAYLGGESTINIAGKRKKQNAGKNFFRESILLGGTCGEERILHQVLHRSDGAYKLRLSCRNQQKRDENGKIIYEEVLMEKWKHARVTQKQYIHAMRKCGRCGKRGLVPIESTTIEAKKKQHPHSSVIVGCLFCGAKGVRKIPEELAQAWT
jgi:subtilisin family serine protease